MHSFAQMLGNEIKTYNGTKELSCAQRYTNTSVVHFLWDVSTLIKGFNRATCLYQLTLPCSYSNLWNKQSAAFEKRLVSHCHMSPSGRILFSLTSTLLATVALEVYWERVCRAVRRRTGYPSALHHPVLPERPMQTISPYPLKYTA